MKLSFPGCGVVVLWLATSGGAGADWLSDLKSPDMQVRRDAIGAIQTMDDPRIPALCLPLLDDPGLSIRRLAARAIGSRFDEISEADRPRYLAALKACLEKRKDEPVTGTYGDVDDISLMCQRAIGLLSRRYDSPPFSVSPDGKWVLYERRRRPVLAQIAEQQHYLLAPLDPRGDGPDDAYYSDTVDDEHLSETNILKTVETNLPAEQLFAPHWRADGKGVALTLERLERRFYHPILVWSAGAPSQVVVLDESFFQSVLGTRKQEWGTTTEFAGWKNDRVLVRIFDYVDSNSDTLQQTKEAIVSYDIVTKKIARER